MLAGRKVPLRWILLAAFVPVVAGTGLIISSLMAQRMRALALASSQDKLKSDVAVIRKRWGRIVDPERTLTHLEVIDGLVAAIPNPGVDVRRKVLIEGAQLFDEASHLASVNVLKTNDQFVRFHNARLLKSLALPYGTRIVVERYGPDQHEPRFTLFDDKLERMAAWSPKPGQWNDDDPRERTSIDTARAGEQRPVLSKTDLHPVLGPLLTLGQQTPTGAVIEMSVPLAELQDLLGALKLSEKSRLLLLDLKGGIWVTDKTSDPGQIGITLNRTQDPFLQSLQPLISNYLQRREQDNLKDNVQIEESVVSGGDWLLSIAELPGIGLEEEASLLVLAIPAADIYAAPMASVRQAQAITVAIVIATLPLVWLLTRSVTRPLQALSRQTKAIRRFDFSPGAPTRSVIAEVSELDTTLALMRQTVQRFLNSSKALAKEQDIEALLKLLVESAVTSSAAEGAVLTWVGMSGQQQGDPQRVTFPESFQPQQEPVTIPLRSRDGDLKGDLALYFSQPPEPERIAFCEALAGNATVALENASLIQAQKDLFASLITLVAGAIDAKSPYTGAHCSRVPELTQWLAEAACSADQGTFASLRMSENDWEALRLAAWLHDCGKITTPEHVVDKATKLETINNRIHEVRMRFELLKAQAETQFWKQRCGGAPEQPLRKELQRTLDELDQDFAFVATCNQGGESMDDADLERLQRIASRTWTRTLNDRLGLSIDEQKRADSEPPAQLPCLEPLLADRALHRIARPEGESRSSSSDPRFNLQVPELLQNNGELHNLTIRRGTLNDEERAVINLHIVETIRILESLHLPGHLASVPAIAGGHHERMDGGGYPMGLSRDQMTPQARMMAIADVFEALTASDRPYKPAKPLSVVMRIMVGMVNQNHLDPDLFRLFVQQGLHRRYAEQFLQTEQLDAVDDAAVLAALSPPDQPRSIGS